MAIDVCRTCGYTYYTMDGCNRCAKSKECITAEGAAGSSKGGVGEVVVSYSPENKAESVTGYDVTFRGNDRMACVYAYPSDTTEIIFCMRNDGKQRFSFKTMQHLTDAQIMHIITVFVNKEDLWINTTG